MVFESTTFFELSGESTEEDLDGPLQCYRCGENFDSIPSVKSHMTVKHRICRKSHYGKPRLVTVQDFLC